METVTGTVTETDTLELKLVTGTEIEDKDILAIANKFDNIFGDVK